MKQTTSVASTASDAPYREIAGELVADVVALFAMVRLRRPETAAIPGVVHVTLDAGSGEIVVSLATPVETEQGAGHRHVVIKRIAADPARPDEFGESVLPIVAPGGPAH